MSSWSFIQEATQEKAINSAYNKLKGSKSLFTVDFCNQYDLVSQFKLKYFRFLTNNTGPRVLWFDAFYAWYWSLKSDVLTFKHVTKN